MRRAAKVDTTQAPIIAMLRANGMTVKDCSAVGQGFPDLVVGFRGGTYLIEAKGAGHAHRALAIGEPDLTAAQRVFHSQWAGDVGVVNTPEAAVEWVLSQARKEGRL